MRYPNVTPAVFLARPNRFVAQVLLEGREVSVHRPLPGIAPPRGPGVAHPRHHPPAEDGL